jgi:mycofactocin precursor
MSLSVIKCPGRCRFQIEEVDMSEPKPAVGTAPEQLEETIEETMVEDDLLVEDVSIDGMCGVY